MYRPLPDFMPNTVLRIHDHNDDSDHRIKITKEQYDLLDFLIGENFDILDADYDYELETDVVDLRPGRQSEPTRECNPDFK